MGASKLGPNQETSDGDLADPSTIPLPLRLEVGHDNKLSSRHAARPFYRGRRSS
jgi:hypothetical protein